MRYLICLLLLMPLVHGLSISPAQTIVFDEGANTFELSVFHNQSEEQQFIVSKQGELANNIILYDSQIVIENSRKKTIEFTINYEGLSPGEHTGLILIEQTPLDRETTVSVTPGVAHKVTVYIPKEGSYIAAQLFHSAPRINAPLTVSVPIRSIGTEDIQDITAIIEIRDPKELIVFSREVHSGPLLSQSSTRLVSTWSDPKVGTYLLRATLLYEGKTLILERELIIGDFLLIASKPQIQEYDLGEVIRLDIPLQNTWNQDIRGVKALVTVYQNQRIVQEFKTTSVMVPQGGRVNLTGFWETQGLRAGSHTIVAKVVYADRSTDVEFSTRLRDYGLAGTQARFAAFVGLLTLTLIIVTTLIYMKRKK